MIRPRIGSHQRRSARGLSRRLLSALVAPAAVGHWSWPAANPLPPARRRVRPGLAVSLSPQALQPQFVQVEPRDWPFEKPAKGTLRPWFLSAKGYVAVLFRDPEEAQRAHRGLLEQGVPQTDVRPYLSEQILSIASRLEEERSIVAKAVAALTVDRAAWDRYLDNARAGGAALWLFASTEDQANRLVRLLADYRYASLRYYGDDRVETIRRDPR